MELCTFILLCFSLFRYTSKRLDIIHDIMLWHFSACTTVQVLTVIQGNVLGINVKLHPHHVKLNGIQLCEIC